MVALEEITDFLDKYLDTANVEDHFINGLVARGKKDIKKIALAVDPCMDVLKKAKSKGCELVITHHGLFIKEEEPTEVAEKRRAFLEKNSISLYVSHHPLDIHSKIGNSKIMADILNLANQKPFCRMSAHFFGVSGTAEISLQDLKNKITQKIGPVIASHEFGPKRTKNIGIVSGSGSFAVHQMKAANIDTLLTGSLKHDAFYTAEELEVNVIYAGHYATEVFGVAALGEKLKNKFDKLSIVFIKAPTGL